MKKKKGQGILEYVVVLTAIVAVIILTAATVMRDGAEDIYETAGGVLDNANTILSSAGGTP